MFIPVFAQQIEPPAIVIINDHFERIEAERRAELERIAAEQAKQAAEEAERIRMAAVWTLHPAGNGYEYKSCTWWVATWTRIPMGLGNAKYWYSRAKAWGFNVGLEPRVGAVGVVEKGRWGHVVWITAVDGDYVTIKEGNYNYKGSVRTRRALASAFKYIYL